MGTEEMARATTSGVTSVPSVLSLDQGQGGDDQAQCHYKESHHGGKGQHSS